jgi:hypothetical protein
MASAETDHAGCQLAYERQRRRAEFAEARLAALVNEFYRLASRMDGIQGHTPHERLGGKTLGGSVRWLLSDLSSRPAPTAQSADRAGDAGGEGDG